KRRDWDSATADLKRAIALRPGDIPAYINLALTHRQRAELHTSGRPSPWQAPALLLGPQGAYALLTLEAYRQQARQEAVAVLDEAIRRQPGVSRLYHERGQLRLLLHDAGGAQ